MPMVSEEGNAKKHENFDIEFFVLGVIPNTILGIHLTVVFHGSR